MVMGLGLGVKEDESTRRVKRRRLCRSELDVPDFKEFPPPQSEGQKPFRDSIKEFLSRHAQLALPPSLFPSLLSWRLSLRLSSVAVALHVVEEDVTSSSRSLYCDHCRVLAQVDDGRKSYLNSCSACGAPLLHFNDSRCRRCKTSISADDVEDWINVQLEDHTHLLHAVVHSNGFGHLLTLNGRQGGSLFLSGRQIMDFWDRLCCALFVRKISVMDVSKKHGMEYRLLHAITDGHSWYGNWGYQFGAGSYALTQDAYLKAVHSLSSTSLSPFLFHPRAPQSHLQSLIALYQSLSHTEFATFKDLFSFLLSLLRQVRALTSSDKPHFPSSNALCAWTRNDVECLQQAMIKILRASTGCGWVTRRALKGTMCKAASPELLEYCLKHFGGNVTHDGMVVHSHCNPTSSTIEYRLEPLSSTNARSGVNFVYPSEEQVLRDLRFLYESFLHPDTMVSYKPQRIRDQVIDSATKLLDCKQFVKVYVSETAAVESPQAIHLWCDVQLSDQPKGEPVVPPELIVLPLNANVAGLKSAVTQAFREVYPMFKRFQAEELVGYGSIDDSITVKFLVGTGGSVRLAGKCAAKHGLNRFRMERGIESWTVSCSCGAKDDDGERMLACDTCGVWQHIRCVGIANSDEIPAKFVCLKCINTYRNKHRSIHHSTKNGKYVSVFSRTCRGKAAASDDLKLTTNLTMASSVR
ncbi:PHD finger protein At1g33420 isoform X2 [Morus notabilis]|uniref:PHD finger protein At1g33420 isoform X2 n=1 Tax=Morus notabilis TaxID=981085 RepID=UPI000CECF679|nr:PHD finger protein At1g33420 isoform X2 [Morus notabilis]